jgi:hypothetical protein
MAVGHSVGLSLVRFPARAHVPELNRVARTPRRQHRTI